MLLRDQKGTMKWVEIKEELQQDNPDDVVTDRESYIPELSQLQTLGTNGTIKNRELLYEFKDGKDNGERAYIYSNKALDVTEKEELIKELRAEVKAEKANIEAQQKALEEAQKAEEIATTDNVTSSVVTE